MCQYKYLSNIYDESMKNTKKTYDNWLEIIQNFIQENKVSVKNILELGCGSGNVTVKLLNSGYEVVGIDNSYEMLEIARQKTSQYGDKIILLQQDLCELEFDIYNIDMIVAINDVVNYIVDEQDIENIFEFCYKHLKKDGIFVFDISSKFKIENILANNTFFEDFEDTCMIWQNEYDEQDNILDMYIDIFKKNTNCMYERLQEVHTQKAYDETYLDDLLTKIGFKYMKKEYIYVDDNNYERIFYCLNKVE